MHEILPNIESHFDNIALTLASIYYMKICQSICISQQFLIEYETQDVKIYIIHSHGPKNVLIIFYILKFKLVFQILLLLLFSNFREISVMVATKLFHSCEKEINKRENIEIDHFPIKTENKKFFFSFNDFDITIFACYSTRRII